MFFTKKNWKKYYFHKLLSKSAVADITGKCCGHYIFGKVFSTVLFSIKTMVFMMSFTWVSSILTMGMLNTAEHAQNWGCKLKNYEYLLSHYVMSATKCTLNNSLTILS